ncbi:hypothetical protein BC937DRAFT_86681 [Endogone sp. FLAS-F59071]|nr:hypothetical protein BC937DRAFT_86681 [Endogone sp. FLAS-F59071]|eukprot:RUS19942.1 hypothetical protein BC937DRAFT_86681 [Endogone sp. FLAS-F59071]
MSPEYYNHTTPILDITNNILLLIITMKQQGQIDLSTQMRTKMDKLSSRLDDLEHSVHDLDVEMHSDDDDGYDAVSFTKPALEPPVRGSVMKGYLKE